MEFPSGKSLQKKKKDISCEKRMEYKLTELIVIEAEWWAHGNLLHYLFCAYLKLSKS